jgi:hypothetical protein
MCKEDNPDRARRFCGDGSTTSYPPQSYQGSAQVFKANTAPLVRWNLGNGEFGPLEVFPVMESGQPSAQLTNLMNQPVPVDPSTGHSMSLDRGTRALDVDGDGRTDVVAFRLQASNCKDNTVFRCGTLSTVVIVYLSAGDHFELRKSSHGSTAGSVRVKVFDRAGRRCDWRRRHRSRTRRGRER